VKIIIITPVRDEEEYIKFTIESVIAQTLLPYKWVIVDDGSSDNTGKIIQSYIDKVPFLQYVRVDDRGYRKPGQGVVQAFYEGFKKIEHLDYDVIAKMDGDLQFGRETFQTIVKKFEDEPQLGVTGVVRYERTTKEDQLTRVTVAKGHVTGAFKFYRKNCFEDIGGLVPRAGWDGVDIVRARMKGWETGEIDSLKLYHLRPTGTAKGEGLKKAYEKYGDISYYMGGYLWYFILRVVVRSLKRRNPRIGLYMMKGYFNSRRNGVERESPDFRTALRKLQLERIVFSTKHLLGQTDELPEV
jgi:glycosyltransferase involved in cell wall biosynthesis